MTKRLIISTLLLLAAVGASAQYERQGEAGAESNAPWEQIASQRSQLVNFDWMFRQQEAQAYAAVAATIAGKAKTAHKLTCVGICAGSGWQTIGLDMAAFEHVA